MRVLNHAFWTRQQGLRETALISVLDGYQPQHPRGPESLVSWEAFDHLLLSFCRTDQNANCEENLLGKL